MVVTLRGCRCSLGFLFTSSVTAPRDPAVQLGGGSGLVKLSVVIVSGSCYVSEDKRIGAV